MPNENFTRCAVRFVGSHLDLHRLARGDSVIGVDLFNHCGVQVMPLRAGEGPHTELDAWSSISNVGYWQTMSVEEGVGNFVRWYREDHRVE